MNLWFKKAKTSALAQYTASTRHNINFDVMTMGTTEILKQHIIMEATEIKVRPDALNNCDDSLQIHKIWKSVLNKEWPSNKV